MSKPKVDLTNPIYHDNDVARGHLEKLLWPRGPVCPRCGATGDRITKLKGKSTRPGVYKCKDCRKPFTVTVGTAMERTKIPLSKWVMAAQLIASSKQGMSAKQLERMLGTNYETAWFLFHRLRECALDSNRPPIAGEKKLVGRVRLQAQHPDITDAARGDALLRAAKGKRLMYHQRREARHAQAKRQNDSCASA